MGIDLETTSGGYLNVSLDDARINLNSSDNLEPHNGMEFESKEDAFSFYKEYAKSVGFTTIIKASRRSRISGKFIDAKFVCTRYGNKKEATTSAKARDSIPGTDSASTPMKRKRGRISLSWLKTDCAACLHVKRREDGRWIIRTFIKEHNHETFPHRVYCTVDPRNLDLGNGNADALHGIQARTKTMHIPMSRQSNGRKKLEKLNGSVANQVSSSHHLALADGDAELMLNFFTSMQDQNPYFFYAIDLTSDQNLRNIFWVDAKGRVDYGHFSDVVSFDTTYVSNEYKLPLVPFIGVNHHGQLMLLGCGLIADETQSTYVWLLRAWLRAMGGRPPKVILTNQHKVLKEAISEVFPSSRHCFFLWHILGQIPEKLGHVTGPQESFMATFNKCIFGSCTNEEFERRWWKIADGFNLRNDALFQSLYEDREYWVPMFMEDIFLAGMSTTQRSESVNFLFDRHMQRKTALKEFLDQYKAIIHDRCEEEAKADFETWRKQPALKSPSPFGKEMAALYTHTVFKKFQVEVLGGVACHPRKKSEDGPTETFSVQDFEQNQEVTVIWNSKTSAIACSCRLFEFNGFLCRHVMIVLQMSGVNSIPSRYILKRWTKDAKSRQTMREKLDTVTLRAQRYKDLCLGAFKLSDEGSLSEESYNVVLNALEDALRKCGKVNDSIQNVLEPTPPTAQTTYEREEVIHGNNTSEMDKDDTVSRIGQVHGMHDGWQLPQEHTNTRTPILDVFFGTQQLAHGMGQINSIAPNREEYYSSHHDIQGLAQMDTIASIRDAHDINQQKIHGMGQLNFRAQTSSSCFDIQDALQHTGMASKHLQSNKYLSS